MELFDAASHMFLEIVLNQAVKTTKILSENIHKDVRPKINILVYISKTGLLMDFCKGLSGIFFWCIQLYIRIIPYFKRGIMFMLDVEFIS